MKHGMKIWVHLWISGDEYSAKFLINKGCDVKVSTNLEKETALHLVAGSSKNGDADTEGMARIARMLILYGADINAVDTCGR